MLFDLFCFCIRCALVMAIVFAPFVALCLFLRSERRLFARISISFVGGVGLLAAIILLENVLLRRTLSELFHVGPSMYSIQHSILPVIVTWVWLPVAAIGLCFFVLRHLDVLKTSNRWVSVTMVSAAVTAAAWTIMICFFGEYTHEDSRWAEGFTKSKWKQVQMGMTKPQVYELIGKPLEESAPGLIEQGIVPQRWVTHGASGYYAAVWFTNDHVMMKRFWWMD